MNSSPGLIEFQEEEGAERISLSLSTFNTRLPQHTLSTHLTAHIVLTRLILKDNLPVTTLLVLAFPHIPFIGWIIVMLAVAGGFGALIALKFEWYKKIEERQ